MSNILSSVIFEAFSDLFLRWGVSLGVVSWLGQVAAVVSVIIVALAVGWLLNVLVGKVISRFVRFTNNKWDDAILDSKVIHNAVKIIPSIIVSVSLSSALKAGWILNLGKVIVEVLIVVQFIRLVFSLTKAMTAIYSRRSGYALKPVQVFFQIINVVSIFFGGIAIISIIFDKSFGTLIAGLGASMAVILLIFKDSILGFVSGWQLSANDQLRIGDWITVSKYGADGVVEEMSLYSVKVRNFDNTITTVPPYALISESFQNWRGMKESGARRIKRSLFIDIRSVHFCSDEMLARMEKVAFLKDYLDKTKERLAKMNSENAVPEGVNWIRQTNIGVFRAYVTEYLKHNSNVDENMTCMVRQLQPTEKGIPLEIYCFAKTTEWTVYEDIQSDIFDHVISVVPEFGLEIFQNPTRMFAGTQED